MKARGFFRSGQCAFFDIRVAHVNASSYGDLSTEQILDRAGKEKKRAYNSRVMEVEHDTFTPLVFGTNGAMGEECAKFYKLLAAKLAQKNGNRYSTVMQWLRTRYLFTDQLVLTLILSNFFYFNFITTFSLFLIWDNFYISSLLCILNSNF